MEYCMRRTHPSILAALAACVVSVVPAFATQAADSAGWTIQASMPTPRGELAVVRGNSGALYALGGANASGVLATVEAYNPMANRWVTRAALPTARADLGAAVGGDGRIYAIGGDGSDQVSLATVEAYSPQLNTWQTVASMPTARQLLAVVAGPDGRIYALGGSNGSVALATVEAYTPVSNTWAELTPLPTPRWGLAAAVGGDGRIYAIGGVPTGGGWLRTVEAYTPSTNTWSEVAPMPRAIADLAAATSRAGTVYAIGGVGYADPSHLTSTVLATVYAYTPSTGSWQRAANMPTARRYLGAATATDGRLFAIGGSDGYPSGGSYLGNVEAYNP